MSWRPRDVVVKAAIRRLAPRETYAHGVRAHYFCGRCLIWREVTQAHVERGGHLDSAWGRVISRIRCVGCRTRPLRVRLSQEGHACTLDVFGFDPVPTSRYDRIPV